MKTLLKIAVFAIVTLIVASSSFAQEWTKEQKEVWQVVETGWAKYKAGDVTGGMVLIHEKYQGWNAEIPLPLSKDDMKKWYDEMKDFLKVNYYFISPARIVVTDDAAVVDYYYEVETTYTWGEEKKTTDREGKNVEFYIKEDGKWLLLGDMTVPKSVK